MLKRSSVERHEGEGVDLKGEGEVFVSERTCVVCGEVERDLPVRELHVGVMLMCLCERPHLVHPQEWRLIALKAPGAREGLTLT